MSDLNYRKISFYNALMAVAYSLYGKEVGDQLLVYYEDCCKGFEGIYYQIDPIYFKIIRALKFLVSISLNDDVSYFEAEENYPLPIFREISREDYWVLHRDFIQNRGKVKFDKKQPSYELYFSENVVTYLLQATPGNIINHDKVKSYRARQLELIGKEIFKQNYQVTEKKFFTNDILSKVYPKMGEHDQTACWKFFLPADQQREED